MTTQAWDDFGSTQEERKKNEKTVLQKKQELEFPGGDILKKLKVVKVDGTYTLTLKEENKEITIIIELHDVPDGNKKVTVNAVGEFVLPSEVVDSMITEMIKQINN